MATAEVRLNHTIYINNLNEKIKKDGKFMIHSLQALQLNIEMYQIKLIVSLI